MNPFKCRFRKHGGEGKNTGTLQSGVKYLNSCSARHMWGQMVSFRHMHTHSFSHFFSCYQKDLSGLLNVQTKLSFIAQNLLLTSNTQRIRSNLSLHHTGYLINISSNHPLVLVGLLLFQQRWSPC